VKNNMKTNLKNRPKNEGFGLLGEYEKWFKDFEAELREKLVYPTNTKSVAVYDFIKEILGESE